MIGIIGAMQIEVDALTSYMQEKEELIINGIHFTKGAINNKDVVVTLSGVGKVCASMSTTTLFSNFDIEFVINIGTAGGLLETQNVLDIVVATNVIQHDFDTSLLDGESGRGIVTKCDSDLVELCREVLHDEHKIWFGDIVTGDEFVASLTQIERILTHFPSAIACEMEAAAIGFVCDAFQTPAILIRSLSDNAYHPNSAFDFMTYAKTASKRSAKFCVELISHLD